MTRGYEMCADRHISVTAVARYLEHARWVALADPEFGPAKFALRGVIRAQRVELYSVLLFHVDLEVTTVLGRVGRTSFDYVHEIRTVEDSRLVGRAEATIVALGPKGPTPVDPAMAELREDASMPAVPPPTATAPENAHVESIRVRPSDQDVLRHVNHARYLDYATDVLDLADRAGALGEGRPSRTGVRAVAIAYDDQAVLGDTINARCWGNAPDDFGVELRRASDGRILTRCRLLTGLRPA